MASKKTNDAGTSNCHFDKNKFLNKKAAKQFTENIVKKTLVPERGISLHANHPVTQEIVKRGWEEFTKQPEDAIVPVVREFYANVVNENGESRVYVQGKWVRFDAETINKFYNLNAPDIEIDMEKRDIPLKPLTRRIAVDGSKWDKRDNEAVNLKPSFLREEARIWYSFIGAKLMPTTHYSSVNMDRAIMIYDFVSGTPLNVGEIIENSILTTIAQTTTGGLVSPHLITCLCREAGVKWSRGEEIQQPTKVIDESVVKLYKPRGLLSTSQTATTSSKRQRSKIADVADRLSTLEDEVRAMRNDFRDFCAYNVEFNSALARLFQTRNGNAPIDVTFPTPPAFTTDPRNPGHKP